MRFTVNSFEILKFCQNSKTEQIDKIYIQEGIFYINTFFCVYCVTDHRLFICSLLF